MVQVRVLLGATRLSVFLQMLLRVLQVVCACRVASPYRALLEVALENVTPAKSVLAEMALVRSLTGIWETSLAGANRESNKLTAQKMALEMFQVEVGLVAVRTLVLALCVLGRSGGRLACRRRGPARMRRQNSAAPLLADDVHWLWLLIGKHRRVRVHGRVSQSHAWRRAELVAVGVRRGRGQHGCL